MIGQAAFFVALAPLAFAAPTEDLSRRGGFSVQQVERLVDKTPINPAQMILNTYNKYATAGASPPQKIIDASKQQGSVAAQPAEYDSAYLSPVSVGGQTLYLDFDTGSSDLWVFSTLAPENQTTGHNVYDPTKSSASKKLDGQTFNITYGDGSFARGVVYSDKVSVGSVTATSQAVEAATEIPSSFTQRTGTDGLLGLSFSSLNTVKPTKQLTFFDTVANSLSSRLFTVDLKAGKPGSYDFGFVDKSKYTGRIVSAPVNNSTTSPPGFWTFTAGAVTAGKNTTSLGNVGTVVADTGTSLMYAPEAVAYNYWIQVPRAASYFGVYYIFPCNETLPDYNTRISDHTFTVPGKYLNFQPFGELNGEQYCLGGLQASTGFPFSIYGDIFLKSVFAVFDQTQAKPKLGFAEKKLA